MNLQHSRIKTERQSAQQVFRLANVNADIKARKGLTIRVDAIARKGF